MGALNLYSETEVEYGPAAQAMACAFADQLGVAAARVTLYVEGYELSQQLQQAMESRAAIEQAKGILMAAQRCSPDAAFGILVRASQNQNRKLRAIAQDIVDRFGRGDDLGTTGGPKNGGSGAGPTPMPRPTPAPLRRATPDPQ
jgi:GAF domain-containing protein